MPPGRSRLGRCARRWVLKSQALVVMIEVMWLPLATLFGLFRYLTARGVLVASPVPSGANGSHLRLPQPGRVPPIRTPVTMPRLLNLT